MPSHTCLWRSPPRGPESRRRRTLGVQLAVGLAWVLTSGSPVAAQTPSASGARPQPLPPVADLRPLMEQWGFEPRRQGDRPTCSAFTLTGALEFAIAKRQERGTRLSAEFLNWSANRACGGAQDGGFFSELWKGFAAYGICAEADMPYRKEFAPAQPPSGAALADAKTRLALGLQLHWIKEWNVKTGLTDEHLVEIKRTLNRGWPVCGGLRWPKQEQWVQDVLQMCPPEAVRDGHSVLLVGFRDDAAQPGGGVFIFRNTASAGRDGFMPYAYARAYMNDAVWVDYGP